MKEATWSHEGTTREETLAHSDVFNFSRNLASDIQLTHDIGPTAGDCRLGMRFPLEFLGQRSTIWGKQARPLFTCKLPDCSVSEPEGSPSCETEARDTLFKVEQREDLSNIETTGKVLVGWAG